MHAARSNVGDRDLIMAVPSSQLERENRRMEERLGMLKEVMRAEKARRGVSGSVYWRSARPGPLQPKPMQTSIAAGQQEDQKGRRPVRVKVLTGEKGKSAAKPVVKHCGQCDKFSATLVCVECTECYCSVCFAKFHQKGALAKHHVRALVCKLPAAQSTVRSEVGSESKRADEGGHLSGGGAPVARAEGGQLLQGNYDEAASAAAFQEALAAWRRGGQGPEQNTCQQKSCNTSGLQSTGCGTQTSSAVQADRGTRSPEIQFSGNAGVSYFEKLMMRWYRVEPSCHVHRKKQAPQSVGDDSHLDTAVSQYNLFYSTDEEVPGSAEDVCSQLCNVEDVHGIQSTEEEKEAHRTSCLHAHENSPLPLQRTPSDGGLADSVRVAWAHSSQCQYSSDKLMQFFLSGVEGSREPFSVNKHQVEREGKAPQQPMYTASVWLPSNSVIPPSLGEGGGQSYVGPEQLHALNMAADLKDTSCLTLSVDSEEDTSDSELLMLEEEEGGGWEVCEREDCDSQALDSLAWELASRAPSCTEERNDDITFNTEEVDMDKLISDFELYQQQLMEQD